MKLGVQGYEHCDNGYMAIGTLAGKLSLLSMLEDFEELVNIGCDYVDRIRLFIHSFVQLLLVKLPSSEYFSHSEPLYYD